MHVGKYVSLKIKKNTHLSEKIRRDTSERFTALNQQNSQWSSSDIYNTEHSYMFHSTWDLRKGNKCKIILHEN